MSEINITIEGGTSKRLLTAGKYCERDIVVTAEGGGGSVNEYFAKTLEEVDCDEATEINAYAFYENLGIKRVRFANATSIGAYQFQNCSNLVSVDLPEAVGEIGSSFCNGCKKLTSVNIPKITALGNYAFQNANIIKKIN